MYIVTFDVGQVYSCENGCLLVSRRDAGVGSEFGLEDDILALLDTHGVVVKALDGLLSRFLSGYFPEPM